MAGIFIKKDLARLIAEADDPNASEGHDAGFKRTLSATGLTALGIGAIIGAGIFSLTGSTAAYNAGPGVVYSFIIGAVLCAFAGLCYAEMAAMIPVSGSAYAYTYATMGEFIAWIIGWDLILEYAFGAVTVAASWSAYIYSWLHKTLGIQFPDLAIRLTKGRWETVTLNDGSVVNGVWNLPATFVVAVMATVLYRGIKESSFINNLIVAIKVIIVIAFIALGWAVIDQAAWIGDPGASGLASLVPVRQEVERAGSTIMTYGWQGVVTGAGVVFFAFIGFDAVSTTAQECKNPRRDLPIGILSSLVVCTLLYVLISLVLTGVVPYRQLGVGDPVAVGIDRIVALRGWSMGAQKSFTFAVKLGALAGLTSVILVLIMAQTRVFYCMAKDGLLPWFGKLHTRHGTPHVATLITGAFVALCAGFMPMHLVGELVSIGTILAFALVCLGIPILRITSPDIARPFKTPFHWFVAPMGVVSCLFVMSFLPEDTWVRLLIWLELGLLIYGVYGWRFSRAAAASQDSARRTPNLTILTVALVAFIPTLIWAIKVFGHKD
jgi:basic amino acid/polyamine antiporter, APA family